MCRPHFASVISDPSTTLHAYQTPYLTEDSLSACPEPSSERRRLRDPDGMSIGRRQDRGCNQHQAACPCVCASGLGIWGGWGLFMGPDLLLGAFSFRNTWSFFFFANISLSVDSASPRSGGGPDYTTCVRPRSSAV